MILIVEDEPHIRQFITVNLQVRGYEVMGAASAEAAFDCIHTSPPSLMFLDVRLPGVTGLDLLSMVDGDAQIPYFCVILLTAYPIDPTTVQSARVIEFLRKPVSVAEILSAVQLARIKPSCALPAPNRE
jgi:DNA-binding response OmpR family regulator